MMKADWYHVSALPGGQQDFFRDWTNRFLFLEGGWGSGKTFIGARKLLTLHLYNAFDEKGQATFVPSVVVGPTYRNMADYIFPALREAAEEMKLAIEWKAGESAFHFPDLGINKRPSRIVARSAERPELIAGWEVGAAWGDEAARWKSNELHPTDDPYLQLTGRVRHPKARLRQLIFTYTNEGSATRIYREAHSDQKTYARYIARTKDNPAVEAFYQQQKHMLSPELAAQYLDGGVADMRQSRVYGMFDPALHLDDSIVYRSDWPLHLSIDFNIRPGMHGLIGQYHETNEQFYVIDEIYQPRMDLRMMMHAFIDWLRDHEASHRQVVIFGDAAGAHQWAGTGETQYAIIRAMLEAAEIPYRLRVPKANPPIIDRVNTFNCALKGVDALLHWHCHPRCKRLIDDLQLMMFDEQGQVDKRDPQRSHASDAEGYRIWQLRPLRRKISDVSRVLM